MNIMKTGEGVVFSLNDTTMAFVFDQETGAFKMNNWEDMYCLQKEGVVPSGCEKDLTVDLSLKINNLVVWTKNAEELARERHKGMVDKAGNDYFTSHISRVVDLVRNLFGSGYLPIIAYLHDIMEDTETDREELLRMFPAEVVDAVDALTRKGGESYPEYISRIKTNPLAIKVKICDLANNMDPNRLKLLTSDERRKLERKYAMAFAELLN